jgi:hypothetical protein
MSPSALSWVAVLALSACGGRRGLELAKDGGAGTAGQTTTPGGGGSPAGASGSNVAGAGGSNVAGAGGGSSVGGAAGSSAGASGSGAAGASGAGTAGAIAVDAGTDALPVDAAPPSAACMSYCTTITANCTGVNAQYRDLGNCLTTCAYLAVGAPSDQAGNTVGCRANSAVAAAADMKWIKDACWGAGPLGFGVCGAECDTLCAIATSYCSPAHGYAGRPPYASMDECEAACGDYSHVVDFAAAGVYAANYVPGTTADTIDTIDCRAYHLIVGALRSPADQSVHCPFVAAASAACAAPPAPGADGGPFRDATAVDLLSSGN